MSKSGIFVGAAVLILGWLVLVPRLSGPAYSAALADAISDAVTVRMIVHTYAQEHEGRLPDTLKQLLPYWANNEKPFERMHLTMPGVRLADLPAKSIILVKVVTDPKQKETRLVFFRADLTVDIEQPEKDREQREATSRR